MRPLALCLLVGCASFQDPAPATPASATPARWEQVIEKPPLFVVPYSNTRSWELPLELGIEAWFVEDRADLAGRTTFRVRLGERVIGEKAPGEAVTLRPGIGFTIAEPGSYRVDLLIDGKETGAHSFLEVGRVPCVGGGKQVQVKAHVGPRVHAAGAVRYGRWVALDEPAPFGAELYREGELVHSEFKYPNVSWRLHDFIERNRSREGTPGNRVTDLCAFEWVEEGFEYGRPFEAGRWAVQILEAGRAPIELSFEVTPAGEVVGQWPAFKPNPNDDASGIIVPVASRALEPRADDARKLAAVKKPVHEPLGEKGWNQVVLPVTPEEVRALCRSDALLTDRLAVNDLSNPVGSQLVSMGETYRHDNRGLSEHEKTVEYRRAQAQLGKENNAQRMKARRQATELARKLKAKIGPLSGPWTDEERPE